MGDELRITLLGFGSANRALARMLLAKSVSVPTQARGRRFCLRDGGESNDDDSGGKGLVPWRIVGIITRRHGRVCVPLLRSDDDDDDDDVMSKDDAAKYWSIDLEMALHRVESGGGSLDRSIITNYYQAHEHDNIHAIISDNQVTSNEDDETLQLISRLGRTNTSNILVEAIPSNSKGNGEPAISFIAMALKSKMHVVSASKVPLAHSSSTGHGKGGEETYWKLQQLAQGNKVTYQHESAVMDGIPLFSLWKYTLPHAAVTSIRGCLNSTTTMILSRMEGNNIDINDSSVDADSGGESFQDALNAAKEMGIVEEDESLDLDGYDAAVKLRALLVVLSSSSTISCNTTIKSMIVPPMDEIPRDSIRNVTHEDIRRAYSDGRKKYRLVATARLLDVPSTNMEQEGNKDGANVSIVNKRWEASVRLQLLSPSDPLYNLSGTDSAVQFCTDVLGPVMLVSSNPTLIDTAYGLYSDIARIASLQLQQRAKSKSDAINMQK